MDIKQTVILPHCDDNVSFFVPFVGIAVRLSGLFWRIAPVDDCFDASCLDQLFIFLLLLSCSGFRQAEPLILAEEEAAALLSRQ